VEPKPVATGPAGPPSKERAAAGQTSSTPGELLAQLGTPLRNFLATEAGSVGLLIAATLVALVWANSPLSDSYTDLWGTELAILLGDLSLEMDLAHWVGDGLMALFFFVIGLEVRRELAVGELTDRRRVTIPAIAAVGGMVVPALLYLAIAPSGDAAGGWGVVIATDTAFMLGALAVVGPGISTQLRVFLLTLTIADDVVAVALIGVVYSGDLDFVALAVAGGALIAIALLSWARVGRGSAYLGVGIVLWVATVESGLHPTIAGMLAGLLITAHPPNSEDVESAARLVRAFRQSPMPSLGRSAKLGVTRAVSLNERLQEVLHPVSSYFVVPLFALAYAGIDLRGGVLGDALGSAVTWGIVAGLVVGKTIGISVAALGAVRLRWGRLPRGVGEGQVVGGAALSGIGFTVSLLIVALAFESEALRQQATVGVLLSAVLSTIVGWIAFRLAARLRGEHDATLPLWLDPPVDPARDHIRGPVDAPLTLVEFGDFECPFCGRATGMNRELRKRFGDELRYVFRHLPLDDVHPHAELAAEGAEAAGAQGRFWEMHDLLFAHQGELELEDLIGYAGELGLDVERFTREIEEGVHAEHLREDIASAEASGARGTPTFFVGEHRHVGPWDAVTLERELRAVGARD
jgi:Na+/H+ antiporter NhaA